MIRRADIDALWAAQGVLDRLLPVYFGAFFAASFVVLHGPTGAPAASWHGVR